MFEKIKFVLLMFSTFLPSKLRIFLLRLLGHKIGKNVKISISTILYSKRIEISDDVRIGPLNIVMCGTEIKIGFSSEISFLVIIYGRNFFHLGQRSYISIKTYIDTTGGVEIGNYSGTGPRTMIYSHAIFLPPTKGFPRIIKETKIGNYVWLGGLNFVTAGATIYNNVMSLPCSVISKKVGHNIFFISKDKQIPIDSVCKCKQINDESLRTIVIDILTDFSKSENLNYYENNKIYYVGKKQFKILIDNENNTNQTIIYFIISEKISVDLNISWYNLITLECSPSCNNNFHKKLLNHMRKFFGLHFIPINFNNN